MTAMTADAILEASIAEIGARLRSGDTTSEALTVAALRRAQSDSAHLNAFIRIRAEQAIAQARDLDREAARGRWRGPLHGIPLAHKDCFEREGEAMSVGSQVQMNLAARQTARPLRLLNAAGAVDLGALNLSEMVAGPTGQNPYFGDCRNALDPDRISGGSSSGSGTAVAARIVPGALGSDTGGSIRLPAAMQGIVGLKPTYGRVSRSGCFPRAFSLDCVGPMARSAQDCALLLAAIAGHDPQDSTSLAAPVPDYVAQLDHQAAGSRVAAFETGLTLAPPVRNAFDRLIAIASSRFGSVATTSFVDLPQCYALGDLCAKAEAAAVHGAWMRTQPRSYSQAVYSRTEPGLHVPAVRYIEALSVRASMLRAFVQATLSAADVLILPAMPGEVPTREDVDIESHGRVFNVVAQLTALTRPFSYLGLPVLSMPIGVDTNGLPVGVQLVGRPLSEARLLAMAHALSGDLGPLIYPRKNS